MSTLCQVCVGGGRGARAGGCAAVLPAVSVLLAISVNGLEAYGVTTGLRAYGVIACLPAACLTPDRCSPTCGHHAQEEL